MTDKIHMTVDEFERIAALPENADRRFELINGELIEVPSNPYSSAIAALIIQALLNFVRPRKLGHVTGEQGGYVVIGERLAPDAAFLSYERQRRLVREGYNPNPPNLAVEVVSPSDEPADIERKKATYEKAWVTSWWVYPEREQVEVRCPGQAVETLDIDDTLSGDDILTGFTLPIREFLDE